MPPTETNEETEDSLRDFDLKIVQPRTGYRFSLDPLLLCDFSPDNCTSILDLGTGCGVIPLVMARKTPESRIVGVEFQPAMAELARRNVLLNGLTDQVGIHEGDLLTLGDHFPANGFDLVTANPPYRRQGTGRISPRSGRDLARHESTASLADFLAVAKKQVRPEGKICFIYLPERLAEFLVAAERLMLSCQRLQMVHDSMTAPARMFLVELIKGRRTALQVLPPLFVDNRRGGNHE